MCLISLVKTNAQYDFFSFSSHIAVINRMPLGVEDLRIPDSALSASSRWDEYHGPHRGRLNTQRRGRYRGAWSSRANNRHQWLQIDIGTRALVYGLGTQGRQDHGQWVKAYKVMYSGDGVRWRWYQVRRRTLVSSIFFSFMWRRGGVTITPLTS